MRSQVGLAKAANENSRTFAWSALMLVVSITSTPAQDLEQIEADRLALGEGYIRAFAEDCLDRGHEEAATLEMSRRYIQSLSVESGRSVYALEAIVDLGTAELVPNRPIATETCSSRMQDFLRMIRDRDQVVTSVLGQ
jgi:hypothetical protein